MSKIRVLVVDDSIVVRRVLIEELSAQPDIEVVGSAATGLIALDRMTQVHPDLVILDIEMPEMDGLTTLTHLHRDYPRTAVIMFSSLTELGAAATLEALSRGASDYFAKPSGSGGLEASRLIIRNELIPAIRAILDSNKSKANSRHQSSSRSNIPAPLRASATVTSRIDVVAIGASTGGPNALADVFAALPADFPVPIVVVQHMPPVFTQALAERLSRISNIPTCEANSGTELEPGRAWVAPGDHHLTIVRDGTCVRTKICQGSHENACRPSVDPLLRSVADIYGPNSLAVILTGMGQDGLRGCEVIRQAGGQILVQDEATSVVWGMPGVVARAGLADRVLPLSMIAGEIVRRVRHRRA